MWDAGKNLIGYLGRYLSTEIVALLYPRSSSPHPHPPSHFLSAAIYLTSYTYRLRSWIVAC